MLQLLEWHGKENDVVVAQVVVPTSDTIDSIAVFSSPGLVRSFCFMPWTHHSHSGQFCGHAANTLEEVVQNAIDKHMTVLCLTEHIHRERQDFYPEEEETHTETSLEQLYDDFYQESRRLQRVYGSRIEIFIGFEGEWIRPNSLTIMQQLLGKYSVDLFIGSVHHVHTLPIDYDTSLYHQARTKAGGRDEHIFADYFDSQYELLRALKPPVVGHFDLIRLKADEPNCSFKTWPAVWGKIIRNLEFVAKYGGVMELNSSSLRKGMHEAYPQAFSQLGGRFTLSDDSHGTDQVGLNYHKVLAHIDKAGIEHLHHLSVLDPSESAADPRFPRVCWKSVGVTEIENHAFWKVHSS
nr:putative histidinol-phosphatase [Quercus suber]